MITIGILSTLYQNKYDQKTQDAIERSVAELPYRFISIITDNRSPYVHFGRRKVMNAGLSCQEHIDLFLWLDADIWFEPRDIELLVEDIRERACDFVTGVYYARETNHSATIATGSDYYGFQWNLEFSEELIKVKDGACGLGFCAVSSAALRHYSREYLSTEWFDSSGYFPMCEPPERRWNITGEDLDFSQKMRYIGYPLWVDGRVRPSHAGITQKDFEECKGRPGQEYCPVTVTELKKP